MTQDPGGVGQLLCLYFESAQLSISWFLWAISAHPKSGPQHGARKRYSGILDKLPRDEYKVVLRGLTGY